jgi:general secretion pathway protein H
MSLKYTLKKDCSLGFTLLELTIVMFFMALIAGLSTPFVMSTLDRIELQTSARKVASTLRYARSEAITSKKPVVFTGDLSRNIFWVSKIDANKSPKIKPLTDPIQLTRFIGESENSLFRDGKFTVTFFPQGNSSGGLISINIKESRSLENYYDISVDPITGQTKIKKNK